MEVGDGLGLGALGVGDAVRHGLIVVALLAVDVGDALGGVDYAFVLAACDAEAAFVILGGVGPLSADVADLALDLAALVGEAALQLLGLAERVLADLGKLLLAVLPCV